MSKLRGYIASREVKGCHVPQRVQNLVVRDYCQRCEAIYLLSAAEYKMPGCYMVLNRLVEEIDSVDGLVFYSLFMLPRQANKRRQVYRKLLETGKSLHFALEGTVLSNDDDIERIEDLIKVQQLMEDGSYEQENA